MYEPGSTFKLQTASMALDCGIVHIWDEFDAVAPDPYRPLHHHRFRGQAPLARICRRCSPTPPTSAPRISRWTVGAERQRAWLEDDGHVRPLADRVAGSRRCRSSSPRPPGRRSSTMTVGVRPRHLGLAAARGARHRRGGDRRHWCARPSWRCRPAQQPDGVRVDAAVDLRHHAQADAPGGDRRLRQEGGGAGLLSRRQDRHGGEGRQARLQGGFKENFNVAAFTSVFPMNAPRYAVYMMLDEPHGNKSTYGYSTGRLGGGAGGRAGDRADRADAGHAAGHPGRAGDQPGAVHPAAARPSAGRAGARPGGAVGAEPPGSRRAPSRRADARRACCRRACAPAPAPRGALRSATRRHCAGRRRAVPCAACCPSVRRTAVAAR